MSEAAATRADPLRIGSRVNDIMGSLFGAIGVMAALATRDHPTDALTHPD